MSVRQLDRYVRDFSGRHDTIDQVRYVLRGLVGKRLRYSDLAAQRAPARLPEPYEAALGRMMRFSQR